MIVSLVALSLLQAIPAPAKDARTTQQAFDAATALDATGTPDARIGAWHSFAERVRGNRRTLAIAHIRESDALTAARRYDEAAALARAGLADLPANDHTLDTDRLDGLMVVAQTDEIALDYADAAARYLDAEKLSPDAFSRFAAELGEIRTATYVDPDAALAAVGRADATAATAKTDKAVMSMLRRYHAELLLNRRDIAGARQEAAAAVKLAGGLTARTSADDVSVRSDYAIASILAGKPEDAREYMAMTGAGRLPNGVFGRGVDTHVPDCGGDAGLKPDDLAVVEFTVADDGHTLGVRPVYAAGGGTAALEFARAVKGWSWTPEQLKNVPLFFRNRVRLELRCSTAFERPSVLTYLDTRLGQWLAEQNVKMPPIPTGSQAAALPEERRALAAAETAHGREALPLVPILHLIVRNPITPADERREAAMREAAILEAHRAPPVLRLGPDLIAKETDTRKGDWQARLSHEYRTDPEAMGAIALIEADHGGRSAERARALLEPVAQNASLTSTNPIRSAALIRLASIEQRQNEPEAARALYKQANIPAEACALIDSPPQLLHAGGEFPREAMAWGFEGWALLQYDISASGRVGNERAIISYPPFVFTKAAIATMAGATYAKTFRPDGQLGCGGQTSGVSFRLPH